MNTDPRMPFSPEQRQLLRTAIRESLPNEAVANTPPKTKHILVPTSHRRALDPDAMLVVGIRGAGKSFWWHTLLNKATCGFLGREYLRGQELVVSAGFGRESGDTLLNWPQKETLEALLKEGRDPQRIWRSVLLEHLEPDGGSRQHGPAWTERVKRLEDPAEFHQQLLKHNESLKQKKQWYLLLFDALEHTAEHRDDCLKLIRGVLQLTLDLRWYSNIAAKAFVTPDMLVPREVSKFPDSAKVLANQVALHWGANDLYALLFQYLGNGENPEAAEYFRSLTSENWNQRQVGDEVFFELPLALKNDTAAQEKLLRCLADPYLGPGPRNGRTYQQLVSQLADAHGIVSPRIFLTAIRRAADENDYAATDWYPLHHKHLLGGIRLASQGRIYELLNDYRLSDRADSTVPSPDGKDVHDAMICLQGLEVPCGKEAILERWKNKNLRLSEYRIGGRTPTEEDYQELLRLCEQLGVVEQLPDGQFNVPNVYLVAFGLRRKGLFRHPPGR